MCVCVCERERESVCERGRVQRGREGEGREREGREGERERTTGVRQGETGGRSKSIK